MAEGAGRSGAEIERLYDLWFMDKIRLSQEGWVLLQVLLEECGPDPKGAKLAKLRKYRDLYIKTMESDMRTAEVK